MAVCRNCFLVDEHVPDANLSLSASLDWQHLALLWPMFTLCRAGEATCPPSGPPNFFLLSHSFRLASEDSVDSMRLSDIA